MLFLKSEKKRKIRILEHWLTPLVRLRMSHRAINNVLGRGCFSRGGAGECDGALWCRQTDRESCIIFNQTIRLVLNAFCAVRWTARLDTTVSIISISDARNPGSLDYRRNETNRQQSRRIQAANRSSVTRDRIPVGDQRDKFLVRN